jgi:S-formylglutathione hydrolase FrmB
MIRLALLLLVAAPLAAQVGARPHPLPAMPRGTVVADSAWSQALGIRKRILVYLPPSYRSAPPRRYAVAYYLHGHSGSEGDWTRAGQLADVMDSLAARATIEMIVVMPDGDDGWWTTWNALGDPECSRLHRAGANNEPAATYCVPWPKYDEWVARDLVAHIDSAYRTVPSRERRGIAGLSMGGYGAVALALRYDDVFTAGASHSGVLAPLLGMPFDGRPAASLETLDADSLHARWPAWLQRSLGLAFGWRDIYGWVARDPARLAIRAKARGARLPALRADVGLDDPLLEQNRAFLREARRIGLDVEYAEHPGRHDWKYWRAHVGESLAWLSSRIAPPGLVAPTVAPPP